MLDHYRSDHRQILEGGFPLAYLLLLRRLLDPHCLVGRLPVGLHLLQEHCPQGSHPLESLVLGSLESLLLVHLVPLGMLCDQLLCSLCVLAY